MMPGRSKIANASHLYRVALGHAKVVFHIFIFPLFEKDERLLGDDRSNAIKRILGVEVTPQRQSSDLRPLGAPR